MDNSKPAMIRVWDPFVRIGHWVLVFGFAVAYLTDDGALEIHEWAGYVVAVYLVARVVWGFIGSPHARFSDFLFSPLNAAAYLLDLVRGHALRHIGHSPAGAMMVFALLFMLAGTVTTGMAELALSHGEGPFALTLEKRPMALQSSEAATRVEADGRPSEEESDLLEIHELFANLTLILIGMHIAGVVVSSRAHKENLVRSMITGWKRQ
jgi:cytochrome b